MFSSSGGTVKNVQYIGTCSLDAKGQRYIELTGHRALSYGFDNTWSILDDGVLVNTPFGRSIRVRFLNLTDNKILNTNTSGSLGDNRNAADDIINNPTHLTLRVLFLDDDDLPMR